MYIIAQVIGLLAFIIFILSVQNKNKSKLLIFQLIANVLYGIQYILLNSLTAALMNGVNVIRSYVFYKYDIKNKKIPYYILLTFIFLILLVGFYSYTSLLSLIPILITLLYAVSTFQSNMKILRITFIFCGCLWFYFNYSVGAYTALIGNVFEITSGIVALIRYRKK